MRFEINSEIRIEFSHKNVASFELLAFGLACPLGGLFYEIIF